MTPSDLPGLAQALLKGSHQPPRDHPSLAWMLLKRVQAFRPAPLTAPQHVPAQAEAQWQDTRRQGQDGASLCAGAEAAHCPAACGDGDPSRPAQGSAQRGRGGAPADTSPGAGAGLPRGGVHTTPELAAGAARGGLGPTAAGAGEEQEERRPPRRGAPPRSHPPAGPRPGPGLRERAGGARPSSARPRRSSRAQRRARAGRGELAARERVHEPPPPRRSAPAGLRRSCAVAARAQGFAPGRAGAGRPAGGASSPPRPSPRSRHGPRGGRGAGPGWACCRRRRVRREPLESGALTSAEPEAGAEAAGRGRKAVAVPSSASPGLPGPRGQGVGLLVQLCQIL